MKKSLFTVIELLVVMAVVLVIFSVLCHSFIRAKEIARRAYCLNNLKQISTLANLYNVDRGATPYTKNWLVDFTFCSDYLQDFRVLECPSMDDRVRTAADLNGNTSYHYMGDRQDWLRNNISSGDGTEYGFDASNPSIANLVNNRQEKLVYDKTDNVHCGLFNVVYVESSSADCFPKQDAQKFWFVAESGSLNFPEGTSVVSTASSTAVTVASTETGSGSASSTATSGTSSSSSSGSTSGNTSSTSVTVASTTTTSGDGNNGHGNNVDGVDSSNPGNSKSGQDTDPTVDDEKKNSSTTTTTTGDGNNGHGNNVDSVDSSNPGNSKTGQDTDPTVDDETKGGNKK